MRRFALVSRTAHSSCRRRLTVHGRLRRTEAGSCQPRLLPAVTLVLVLVGSLAACSAAPAPNPTSR